MYACMCVCMCARVVYLAGLDVAEIGYFVFHCLVNWFLTATNNLENW